MFTSPEESLDLVAVQHVGILVPTQGANLHPLHCGEFLTTEPPGEALA